MIRPSAGDCSISSSIGVGAPARRQHQRSVFDERCRDRRDRRCSPAPCAGRSRAVGRRLRGAPRRSARRAAIEHLRQIGPDVIQIDRFLLRTCRRPRSSRSSMKASGWSSNTVSPGGDSDGAHDAAGRCALIGVLHLHRFHHQHFLAGAHRVAVGHREADDGALHRRAQRRRCLRGRQRLDVGVVGRRRRRAGLAVQHDAPEDRCVVQLRAGRARRGRPAARSSARCAAPPRSVRATCSSMKRVCIPPASTSGWRSSACRNGIFVAAPAMRNSDSARYALRRGIGEPAVANARSLSPAASRSAGWCDSRHSRSHRRARRGPDGRLVDAQHRRRPARTDAVRLHASPG